MSDHSTETNPDTSSEKTQKEEHLNAEDSAEFLDMIKNLGAIFQEVLVQAQEQETLERATCANSKVPTSNQQTTYWQRENELLKTQLNSAEQLLGKHGISKETQEYQTIALERLELDLAHFINTGDGESAVRALKAREDLVKRLRRFD